MYLSSVLESQSDVWKSPAFYVLRFTFTFYVLRFTFVRSFRVEGRTFSVVNGAFLLNAEGFHGRTLPVRPVDETRSSPL